jgi:hypothetical protein
MFSRQGRAWQGATVDRGDALGKAEQGKIPRQGRSGQGKEKRLGKGGKGKAKRTAK